MALLPTFMRRFCVTCAHKIFNPYFTRTLATSTSSRYVLGIETSCDDTGAAIVDENGTIVSEALHSQLAVHIRNGGIIPPIARDLHREKIDEVVKECLRKSNLDPSQLEAVAVTNRPGLPLSLLVGVDYAKKIAKEWSKPLIPVHHMEAHCLTIRMVEKIEFPFVYFLISGGHCLLGIADDIDKYQLYGTTTDDAPGEALDKISREMHLSHLPQFEKMSGGQALEIMAQTGDPKKFDFPIVMPHVADCDFSFSGIKWKAKKHIHGEEEKYGLGPDEIIPTAPDVSASFLYCIGRNLGKRLERLLRYCEMQSLLDADHRKVVVSGGVACSPYIRKALGFICKRNNFTLHVPPPKLCTDNGIMIAWNGMEKLKKNLDVTYDFDSVDIAGKASFGVSMRWKLIDAGITVGYIKFPEIVDKPEDVLNEKVSCMQNDVKKDVEKDDKFQDVNEKVAAHA